jgi:RNA polymerase sigma-54 factor
MALKLELNMKLQQQLVMTPQLQMAIKLLQLTRLELAEVISQELEENPTLEEGEDFYAPDIDREFADNADVPNPDITRPLSSDDTEAALASDLNRMSREAEENRSQHDEPLRAEMDWENYFDNYMDGPSDIMPRDTGNDDRPGFEEFYASESSLNDYLSWQLKFSNLSKGEYAIGEEIIGNINDDGYLRGVTLEDLARTCGQDLELVERVHQRVMRFDPLGVAARDLRECLLVQVKFGSVGGALVARIIDEHWALVEKRDVVKMARLLRVTRNEIEDAMRIIATLNPKPGAQYAGEKTEYITPDIYVYKVGDDYHIQLNEDGLPRLRVNSYYQRTLANKTNPQETRDFIKDKLRSASWLIRSIQQRQRTIYKVTESIVRQQREFLDYGVEHLHPMVLRNVAEDIEMHECTVSRVTTNKYVHTPQGIFELKYFFNSGITNSEGEGISSESIKNRIKQLVDGEEARRPLSDQKLVELLKQDGIDVARRTVAKYREMLGILSSSGRRKKF